jgi:hypothetical protein
MRVALMALLAAARTAAGARAARPVCPRLHRFAPYAGRDQCVLDKRAKFIICGAPKGAATTSFLVMLHVARETTAANKWLVASGLRGVHASSTSAIVHRYRIDAFEHAKVHRVAGGVAARAPKLCVRTGWLCVILVRNPLDRAISSFLHVAKTGLGVAWPELVAVVRNVSLVRAGNYSFRQHVNALELLAERKLRGGAGGKWAADHVLPQAPRWLHALTRGHGSTAAAAQLAGAVKLVPVDAVSRGLAAVDAQFRRGHELGLEAATTGLHSLHWVSAGPGLAVHGPAAGLARNATAADGASVHRASRRRVSEAFGSPTRDDEQAIDADTFASVLCGIGARGGFAPSQHGRRHADCRLTNNTYARMQAVDPSVWARVRCLFRHDFELYYEQVCAQGWLRRRCPTCLERACRAGRAA